MIKIDDVLARGMFAVCVDADLLQCLFSPLLLSLMLPYDYLSALLGSLSCFIGIPWQPPSLDRLSAAAARASLEGGQGICRARASEQNWNEAMSWSSCVMEKIFW